MSKKDSLPSCSTSQVKWMPDAEFCSILSHVSNLAAHNIELNSASGFHALSTQTEFGGHWNLDARRDNVHDCHVPLSLFVIPAIQSSYNSY